MPFSTRYAPLSASLSIEALKNRKGVVRINCIMVITIHTTLQITNRKKTQPKPLPYGDRDGLVLRQGKQIVNGIDRGIKERHG